MKILLIFKEIRMNHDLECPVLLHAIGLIAGV